MFHWHEVDNLHQFDVKEEWEEVSTPREQQLPTSQRTNGN